MAALLAYRGDPEVCRYLPFEPMTPEVLSARHAGDLGRRGISGEGEALTLGAERRSDGRLVGDVVLFLHSDPDAAGQGLATEACTAVLDLAFEHLGLHRIVAKMDGRNAASARLAERLGM